jgi:hypothetical protein
MGRSYNPARIIKSSGVHTVYLGRPDDPISQAFEAYCIHTEQTFSESCRDMIVMALVRLGLLKDPGIEEGLFLEVGEGSFTPKFYKYRKQAEMVRTKQLQRLESEKQVSEKKNKVQSDTAFD